MSVPQQCHVVNNNRINQSPHTTPDTPTSLVPLLVQRKGKPDQIFWAPVCHSCRKPILDLRLANVACTSDNWEASGEILSNVGGVKITRLGTIPAAVYCKEHDAGGVPWEDAQYVFARKGRA
jgi:hypothetical protein